MKKNYVKVEEDGSLAMSVVDSESKLSIGFLGKISVREPNKMWEILTEALVKIETLCGYTNSNQDRSSK